MTQRGNRRSPVFFGDGDRLAYLGLLRDYADRHRIEVIAYCLMGNHVHLVAVPGDAEGLNRWLKPVHMRYAQRVNRIQGWCGHLWQGRFHSEPLTQAHLWAAVRYVELNPVRAGLVGRAQDYPWSSAQAHCGMRMDSLLTHSERWVAGFATVGDWADWLEAG